MSQLRRATPTLFATTDAPGERAARPLSGPVPPPNAPTHDERRVPLHARPPSCRRPQPACPGAALRTVRPRHRPLGAGDRDGRGRGGTRRPRDRVLLQPRPLRRPRPVRAANRDSRRARPDQHQVFRRPQLLPRPCGAGARRGDRVAALAGVARPLHRHVRAGPPADSGAGRRDAAFRDDRPRLLRLRGRYLRPQRDGVPLPR